MKAPNWEQLKKRWTAITRTGTAPFTLPVVILEVEPDFVIGARLGESGARRPVRRLGVRRLESGALKPGLLESNVANRTEVERGLRAVAEVIGNGSARAGLLVPDNTVRVGLLSFEALPAKRREAETLICWRMRDVLPFPVEETRLSYQVVGSNPGGLDLMVIAGRHSVLAEYEAALESTNRETALILPSTLALLPLLPEAEGGQLLIHACSSWATYVVSEAGRVRFWRTRELRGAESLLAEVAAETARVLAASLDNSRIEMNAVWLCPRPPATAEMGAALAETLGREVRLLEPAASLASALSQEERGLFESYGATVAGLAINTAGGAAPSNAPKGPQEPLTDESTP